MNELRLMTTEMPHHHRACVKALGLTRIGAART
jgi:ribosomal protein L30/L7E